MKRMLRSTIQLDLSPFHEERIGIIDAEDFTGVKRKVREELAKQGIEATDQYLEDGVLALKQYYAVALLDPSAEHAVSDEIDPFWHAHILHTDQYMAFCEKVVGQYIPHKPLDHGDAEQVAHVAKLYTYTASVYPRLFAYVNPCFYLDEMPDARLLCSHNKIDNADVRANGLDIEHLPIAV